MIRGALLIALAALLWATTGIVAKFLFTGSELQAIALGFLRLVVALPFFFALMIREQKAEARNARAESRPEAVLSRKALLPLLALGVFQAFYQGSYLLAVDLTGAGIATLIAL